MTNIEVLILEASCKCEYLLLYSLDYNPIEYSFFVIKKTLRGQYQLNGNEKPEELTEKVGEIVKEVITSEIARNHFRHCQIHRVAGRDLDQVAK